MKKLAPKNRSDTESLIRKALVGSSLQRVTYAITNWELMFLGSDETKLTATELLLSGQAQPDDETDQAVLVGSKLLKLINTSRVASVSVHANGDLVLEFLNGDSIRASGVVPNVDWTWYLVTTALEFTCDGPFDV